MLDCVTDALKNYRAIQALKNGDEEKLLSLSQAIELKDPYTKGHCKRVAEFALMMADELRLPMEMKKEIRYGSWLHDCGKIGVPESILNLDRKLSDEEYEVIKKHPLWGADLAKHAKLSDTVFDIIGCHHEKFNGKGYPYGLKDEDIPFPARIVAVADVYDALVTDRPYRKGFNQQDAIDIIENMKGETLDPVLVELLFSILRRNKSQESAA